jgi:4-hydroxy-tetrahydrodipicolinate synthase
MKANGTDLTTASGVYVIAATPFHDDGRIDEKSTDSMVDFYRACGADGLTILGIMGEAPKLDMSESVAFVDRCIKRAGKLPVLVGVSAPGFAAMRSLARAVMDARVPAAS